MNFAQKFVVFVIFGNGIRTVFAVNDFGVVIAPPAAFVFGITINDFRFENAAELGSHIASAAFFIVSIFMAFVINKIF